MLARDRARDDIFVAPLDRRGKLRRKVELLDELSVVHGLLRVALVDE
jgi:hypothetical protein